MSDLDSLLHRKPPTAWDRFWASPLQFLAHRLYFWFHPLWYKTREDCVESITVVCISDTHSTHDEQPDLPRGDILVHAGDLTHSGTFTELSDALDWLSGLPGYEHKVFIAGNHDTALADPSQREALLAAHPDLIYLQNSSVELTTRAQTFRVYGSPHTPKHGSWAFQYPRLSPLVTSRDAQQHEATRTWSAIPPTTDILITHGPPACHCDLGHGCSALLDALWQIRPRLHIFGHIHSARGIEAAHYNQQQRAYEDVSLKRAGWFGLVRLMWYILLGRCGFYTGGVPGTLLVNAAAVGGVRDERRDGAVVVDFY